MSHELRLAQLELELPAVGKVLGVYKPVCIAGRFAYTSGHGPVGADGSVITGRLGEDLDEKTGYEAARMAGLAMLASLRAQFGSLESISRLVKTVGYVNAAPHFTAHPAVINGFSELMRAVFGEDEGVGARSATGVASLPAGWAVEIEAIFELTEDHRGVLFF